MYLYDQQHILPFTVSKDVAKVCEMVLALVPVAAVVTVSLELRWHC